MAPLDSSFKKVTFRVSIKLFIYNFSDKDSFRVFLATFLVMESCYHLEVKLLTHESTIINNNIMAVFGTREASKGQMKSKLFFRADVSLKKMNELI